MAACGAVTRERTRAERILGCGSGREWSLLHHEQSESWRKLEELAEAYASRTE